MTARFERILVEFDRFSSADKKPSLNWYWLALTEMRSLLKKLGPRNEPWHPQGGIEVVGVHVDNLSDPRILLHLMTQVKFQREVATEHPSVWKRAGNPRWTKARQTASEQLEYLLRVMVVALDPSAAT